MQVKKQQLEPDMEQWTGSKSGKHYVKTVYCHPAYLTYMKSTSSKMPGWMKHKLESRLPGDRLDAWDKCSGLVHWEDPEGWGREGGGRGDRDGKYM